MNGHSDAVIERRGGNFRVSLPIHADAELSGDAFAHLAKQIVRFQYDDDVEKLARQIPPHAVTLYMCYDDYDVDGDQRTPYYSAIFWCETADDACDLITQLNEDVSGIAGSDDDLRRLEQLFAFDRPAYPGNAFDPAWPENQRTVNPANPYNDGRLTLLALIMSCYAHLTRSEYWTVLKGQDRGWYAQIESVSSNLI